MPHLSMRHARICAQVLQRRLRRVGEELRGAVAEEVDALAVAGLPASAKLEGWAALAAAFPSADLLLDELQVPI